MRQLTTLAHIGILLRMVAASARMRLMVSQIVTITLMTMVVGVMVAALLMVAIYAAYVLLLQQGMETISALSVIAGIILLLIAILGTALYYAIGRLRFHLLPMMSKPSAKRIANAFVKGWNAKSQSDYFAEG